MNTTAGLKTRLYRAAGWCMWILCLGGCAEPCRTFPAYSWGTITVCRKAEMNALCRDSVEFTDRGVPWSRTDGCSGLHSENDDGTSSITVTDSCAGAKSLPHELAHRDGVEDPDDAGYDWR